MKRGRIEVIGVWDEKAGSYCFSREDKRQKRNRADGLCPCGHKKIEDEYYCRRCKKRRTKYWKKPNGAARRGGIGQAGRPSGPVDKSN